MAGKVEFDPLSGGQEKHWEMPFSSNPHNKILFSTYYEVQHRPRPSSNHLPA